MKIPLPKLKAMILFFGKYTDPRLLGKVKLMKLFYFADFGHLKKYGTPITYDTYVHLEHGPIPSAIMNLVCGTGDDIDNSDLSDTIAIEIDDVSRMHRIKPLREFREEEKGYFSKGELSILVEVCKRFHSMNAKQIEEASHQEAAWRDTKPRETISYSLALNDRDCLIDKEEMEILMKILNY